MLVRVVSHFQWSIPHLSHAPDDTHQPLPTSVGRRRFVPQLDTATLWCGPPRHGTGTATRQSFPIASATHVLRWLLDDTTRCRS